jgi:ComF family protein
VRAPDLLDPLLNFISPSLCLICERPVPKEIVVCPRCVEILRRKHAIQGGCVICGAPLRGRTCPRCRDETFAFQRARAPFVYRDEIRLLVELFKYTGITRLSQFLASEMTSVLPALGPTDLIVPLPLNRVKARERGFSQTRLLARGLHGFSKIPLNERALVRVKKTRSQTGLGRKERKLNVKGAFRVVQGAEISGRTVLLVDDVMTTGATLSEAARALRQRGASRVLGIVAATGERI